jgi:sodium pump decarboxylase gamma subunit
VEHGNLILSGFGIVMGVLAMLWGVTAAIATIFNQSAKPKETPAQPAAAPAAAAPAPAPSGVPEHHLAAITAAVAESFTSPHRVVSVSGPYAHVSAWTQQGLFEHFASHRTLWNSSVRGNHSHKS